MIPPKNVTLERSGSMRLASPPPCDCAKAEDAPKLANAKVTSRATNDRPTRDADNKEVAKLLFMMFREAAQTQFADA